MTVGKGASFFGGAYAAVLGDTDDSVGATEESSVFNFFTSFGVHIFLIIFIIVLKWQYGKIFPFRN